MRFSIIGNSGSGKSYLAQKLMATGFGPIFETDELMFGENWAATPVGRYRQLHEALIAQKEWRIAGIDYPDATLRRIAASSHIVLVDIPLWQIYANVTRRQIEWLKTPYLTSNQKDPPDTDRLAKIIWEVDQEVMPLFRSAIHQAAARGAQVALLRDREAISRVKTISDLFAAPPAR